MSGAYDIEYLCYATPVPGPLPQLTALLLPYTPFVWFAVIITILLGGLVCFILSWLLKKSNINEIGYFSSFSNNFLLIYSCVVNTPWTAIPNTNPMRIFIGLWAISFIILAVAYKGSLVSYLTIPLQQAPINTHKEIYEKGIPVGSMGVTFKAIMEQNASPWVRLLSERYEQVTDIKRSLKRASQGIL